MRPELRHDVFEPGTRCGGRVRRLYVRTKKGRGWRITPLLMCTRCGKVWEAERFAARAAKGARFLGVVQHLPDEPTEGEE